MAGRTVGEWAARAATLPAALVNATPEAVQTSGRVLEQAVRVNVAQATGGDSRLSRVRSGKGARITVDLAVVGTGSGAQARVVPRGPIMLVEESTKAHQQPFSYTYNRRVKKRGAKRISIPGLGVFAHVRHPGTAGKHPVARAFAQSHDDAGLAGVLVFTGAVRNHLGS